MPRLYIVTASEPIRLTVTTTIQAFEFSVAVAAVPLSVTPVPAVSVLVDADVVRTFMINAVPTVHPGIAATSCAAVGVVSAPPVPAWKTRPARHCAAVRVPAFVTVLSAMSITLKVGSMPIALVCE